ncbi:hypothetical protein MMC30_003238 [Trapelia coarctata]|nr:hypothetical protein [Trapelia coarctata]
MTSPEPEWVPPPTPKWTPPPGWKEPPYFFSEMEPPIGQSVTLIGPDCWSMGSMMLVEKIAGSPPAGALKVWNDGDSTYCIRPNPEPIQTRLPPSGASADKFFDCAKQAAGYAFGKSTICKVKSWKEGVSSEAETMKFVQKNAPSVPIPELYYYWVDQAWQRSFLLMRRVPGQPLDDAWEKLTPTQRNQIAIETLAQFTSTRLESVDGQGVCDSRLLSEFEGYDEALPKWMPWFHPTYTAEQLTSRLLEEDGAVPPSIGKKFHFYHQDLGPTNIFVADPIPDEDSELPLLAALIDWEHAGYYPRWWIGTTPFVNSAYLLNWKVHPKVKAWGDALGDILGWRGFIPELDWYWAKYDAWVERKGFK